MPGATSIENPPLASDWPWISSLPESAITVAPAALELSSRTTSPEMKDESRIASTSSPFEGARTSLVSCA